MNGVIDLRSDTVTHPTAAMRQAMATAAVGDDVYGDDPTVLALESLAASVTGKESALFVPSGTMGNQLALAVHVRRGEEVVLPENCHVVQHEAGAAAYIAGAQLRCLPASRGIPMAAEAVERAVRKTPDDLHTPRTALITYENADSDGCVRQLAYMDVIRGIADRYGLPVHLDGARLFNAAAALGVRACDIAARADSVMFCLSKGLCAPVGSMLCGTRTFVERARRIRKMLGGGMRQAGILAAAGLVALDTMTGRLGED
ncbi:MAG: threonine aldolase family protein, partial [Clostridia bacterium]|nr:threonine aldolase family protein [Clostridia bacterium]